MEIREIRTFLQVARWESFSRAARELGYSQAAVTIQMKNLEREFDTVLFDRLGKKTQLTNSGKLFLPKAQHILQEIEAMHTEVSNQQMLQGTLRIGTIESIGAVLMPKLITQFHKKYPAVTVQVVLDSPKFLSERLYHNRLDFMYLADRRMSDSTLIKVMEEEEAVMAVVNADHPLAEKKYVSLEEVMEHEIILTEPGESYRDVIDRYLATKGIELSPFLEIGSTEFIVRYLQNQQGITFLPEYTVKDEIASGRLSVIHVKELEGEDSPLKIYRQLLYHKDKWVNPQMRAFIDEMI